MALRQLAPGARDEAVLSAEQASELIAGGFGVGFHTRRHDSLPGLDDRALERALRDGRSELEKFARRRVDVIAYPHGRADRRVAEAARAAHFVLGFTTLRRVVTPDSDPLLAGRLTAPRGSLGEFAVGMLRSIVER
jgi:peptidoglycan/xylan/chitin deacetylase (PgdA/CDA1 family)